VLEKNFYCPPQVNGNRGTAQTTPAARNLQQVLTMLQQKASHCDLTSTSTRQRLVWSRSYQSNRTINHVQPMYGIQQ